MVCSISSDTSVPARVEAVRMPRARPAQSQRPGKGPMIPRYRNRYETVVTFIALWVAMFFGAQGEPSVTLGWDPGSSAGVAGYYVYCQEENALVPTRTDAGTNTQIMITGLKEGFTYRFTVTARNAVGMESLPSEALDYFVPVLLRIIPPSLPTGFVHLQFQVASGHWYEVQTSTNLQTWETIWQTGIANVSTGFDFTPPESIGSGARFFRLQIH